MIKKPNNNKLYILEADPQIIAQERANHDQKKRENIVNHLLKNKKNRGSRVPSFVLENLSKAMNGNVDDANEYK